jgi:iron complex outermembrane receptor protein
MSKRRPVSVAVATALGVASTAGMLTERVYAEDENIVEEIIVTGSRIRRADVDSPSPVTVITRQEIENKGITDVGYLLQRMPSMSGSPIGTTTNNGGNGSVQVDLRGLGPIRTLTLVNGKRTVDGGDYQTIPATMIERVEILKDGASAIYGADAVAGVVNIITRSDYEGFSVEAYTADFQDMDSGAQNSLNLIAGKSFDGGNFMFGAEYVDQEEAYQSDAPWDYFQNSWYIYPGGCENQLTAPYDGTTSGGCYIIGSSRIPESRLAFADQGTFINEGNGLIPYDGRSYNYAPVNYIQTPYERTNIFGNINYELTDDIHLSAEMRYSSRKSSQELAPQPYNSPTDPSYQGVFEGNAYSGISEDNYYLTQAIDAYNATPEGIAGPLRYEPVRDARRRMVETTRRFEQDVDQLQVNVVASGEFMDMNWEVYYNKGWQDSTSTDYGQFFGPNLGKAMGPSADLNGDGNPECYSDISDPDSLIAGCVPMNFFGGPGALTPEMIAYVGVVLVDTFESEQDQWGFNVAGEGWELPGGPMGWAVGYEYRKEQITFTPDSGKQKDEVTGNTGAGTEGSYKTDSIYGEILLPVFDNGTQSLDITAGMRYDDFDTFGSESTYQVGIELYLMEDLKFRATEGEVFRAPSIGEAFAGQVDSFPTYKDPCIPAAGSPLPPGCAQVGLQLDSQLLARVGGNPDLEPEFGDTFTAGIVWTPEFELGSLSVTVDYWETELENMISSLGVNYILDDCYNALNSGSCGLITRRSDYSIAQVLDGPLNVALETAGGIDTEVRFIFDTDIGQFDTALIWSHMTERDREAFPGDSTEDNVGRYTGSDAFAEDKLNYSIDWMRGNFRVAYLGEYISELKSDDAFGVGYTQKVDSQLYHDLTFKYTHPDSGVSISTGINNVTDEEPPYIDLGFNAKTDPSTYRLFGRGYFVRLSWSMGEQ